jgi:hypothetical protein
MPLDTDEARRAALDAVTATGSNTTNRRRLTTIIMATATEKVRLALEALMETAEYKSDYFDRVEAHAKADDLLKFLKFRGIDLTDEQRDEVTSCTDLSLVGLWMDRALGSATSADDIFKK